MAQPDRLSEADIRRAPPGKHADGSGLTLVVKPSGRRSWVARVSADGRRRDIGLGAYPAVSLDEARQRAAELRARALIANGRMVPTPARQIADVPTCRRSPRPPSPAPPWRRSSACGSWC